MSESTHGQRLAELIDHLIKARIEMFNCRGIAPTFEADARFKGLTAINAIAAAIDSHDRETLTGEKP